jgi:hypothetical protein
MVHEIMRGSCMIPFLLSIAKVKKKTGRQAGGKSHAGESNELSVTSRAPKSSQWRRAHQKAGNGPCSAASRRVACVRSLTAWNVALTCGCRSVNRVSSLRPNKTNCRSSSRPISLTLTPFSPLAQITFRLSNCSAVTPCSYLIVSKTPPVRRSQI